MTTLAISTCRVDEPLRKLARPDIRRIPHHQHFPAQILQAIGDFSGSGPLDPRYRYLISEDATRLTATRPDYLDELEGQISDYRAAWSFDRAIIEVSAFNERFVETPTGKVYCNFFIKQDLVKHRDALLPLFKADALAEVHPDDVTVREPPDDYSNGLLHEIASRLNVPILFVGHITPPNAPEKVRAVRQKLSDMVREAAGRTGNAFFDPSSIFATLPQELALRDDGRDYSHFTQQAVDVLSGVYSSWVDGNDHAWIERRR